MSDYKVLKARLRGDCSAGGGGRVQTKVPAILWIILVIVIIIAIVFVVLWLIKTTPALSGIGQACAATSNCASGLTCSSGTCTCLAPLAPTDLTMTSPSPGSLTIKFTPINVAPYSYNIILYNQNSEVYAVEFENITSTTLDPITVIYTSILTAGTYMVKVIPISQICASGGNAALVTGVVVA